VIAKAGSATTVVWNPWIDKAAALADLADDEWKRLLCVETGNLRDAAIRLAPGQSHTMTATFELSPPAKSPTQKNPTS
jgi:D-hexose-6-phosphate mutarotase